MGIADPFMRYLIANDLVSAMPIFSALSANSIFYPTNPNKPTEYASVRPSLFEHLPRSGSMDKS
jgi:gamma-glutamyl:cysteine ligase YbdK (ATP-grasp superfamily)